MSLYFHSHLHCIQSHTYCHFLYTYILQLPGLDQLTEGRDITDARREKSYVV